MFVFCNSHWWHCYFIIAVMFICHYSVCWYFELALNWSLILLVWVTITKSGAATGADTNWHNAVLRQNCMYLTDYEIPKNHCDETFMQNVKVNYVLNIFYSVLKFHDSSFVISRCILTVKLREKCSIQIISSNTIFPIPLRIVMKSWCRIRVEKISMIHWNSISHRGHVYDRALRFV